jgi:hypothetical protein
VRLQDIGLTPSALVLVLALAAPARAAGVEQIETLPSAGAARLPVLFGRDDSREPDLAAVLFNGGGGAVGLMSGGIPRPGANFLVRTRGLFQREGVATAVIDVPTDMAAMNDAVRMGQRHAADVKSVVTELRRRHPGRPVFLIGTSRGTVSAAYAGAALGEAIDGVVLSSSVFNATRGGAGLSGFDYATLRARLLFVHHVDDGCHATPYWMAQRVASGRELVSIEGGAPPRSEPCEAFAPHGYYGVEAPTVAAIVRWMRANARPAAPPTGMGSP